MKPKVNSSCQRQHEGSPEKVTKHHPVHLKRKRGSDFRQALANEGVGENEPSRQTWPGRGWSARRRRRKVAEAYIKAAPQRMVWGSDWPHPTEKEKPNDAVLFDLLTDWAPDEATRRRILVENPEALYGFPKS